MSKTPNYDAAVKKILDVTEPGERICVLTGEKWLMTEEEIGWYKKFNVPPSTRSPKARWLSMAHFSTGYQWWWNKHFDTGEPVLTFIHPASDIKVLPDKEWFSRDFSAVTLDYDLEKSFFTQLRILQEKIPMAATSTVVPAENSIAQASFGDQDSYFVLASRSKSSFYSSLLLDAENCSDCLTGMNLIDCNNVIHSERLHNCRYARESYDCLNCFFVFDCRNCEHCFGATNQRNKKYLWFNEQLSQAEYEQRLAQVDLGSRRQVKQWNAKFDQFLQNNTVWPQGFNEKVSNSVGDYLRGSVDCNFCFNINGGQHSYWCGFCTGSAEDSAFSWGLNGSTDCYLCLLAPQSSKCKFCWRCIACDSCEYSVNCYNCQNCFACVGLQRKSFCIFNKQYSEEEYWKKLDEIKCRLLSTGDYGLFLPLSSSGACVYLGGGETFTTFTAEEIISFGALPFKPRDLGACGFEESAVAEMKKQKDIPDNINDLTAHLTHSTHDSVSIA
jgi:hypothetical protein